VAEGMSAGADDYVRKPFEPVELLSRVRTHFELAQEHSRRLARAQQTAAQLQVALTSNHQIGLAGGVPREIHQRARLQPAGHTQQKH
jgi:DNA-binding response OmpR family regulator